MCSLSCVRTPQTSTHYIRLVMSLRFAFAVSGIRSPKPFGPCCVLFDFWFICCRSCLFDSHPPSVRIYDLVVGTCEKVIVYNVSSRLDQKNDDPLTERRPLRVSKICFSISINNGTRRKQWRRHHASLVNWFDKMYANADQSTCLSNLNDFILLTPAGSRRRSSLDTERNFNVDKLSTNANKYPNSHSPE